MEARARLAKLGKVSAQDEPAHAQRLLHSLCTWHLLKEEHCVNTQDVPAAPEAAEPAGRSAAAPAEATAAPAEAPGAAARNKESLLNAAARARRGAPEESEAEKLLKEERDILHKITQKAALQSVKERALVRVPRRWTHGSQSTAVMFLGQLPPAPHSRCPVQAALP